MSWFASFPESLGAACRLSPGGILALLAEAASTAADISPYLTRIFAQDGPFDERLSCTLLYLAVFDLLISAHRHRQLSAFCFSASPRLSPSLCHFAY